MADILRLKAHIKEHLARTLLQNNGYYLFSPDWIIKPSNKTGDKLIFVEIKQKFQRFGKICKATKWVDGGHGFDLKQYTNYMNIFESNGIRTLLFIFDETDNKTYYNYLDVLNKSPENEKHIFFSAKDNSQIIAWKLNNFKIVGEIQK